MMLNPGDVLFGFDATNTVGDEWVEVDRISPWRGAICRRIRFCTDRITRRQWIEYDAAMPWDLTRRQWRKTRLPEYGHDGEAAADDGGEDGVVDEQAK